MAAERLCCPSRPLLAGGVLTNAGQVTLFQEQINPRLPPCPLQPRQQQCGFPPVAAIVWTNTRVIVEKGYWDRDVVSFSAALASSQTSPPRSSQAVTVTFLHDTLVRLMVRLFLAAFLLQLVSAWWKIPWLLCPHVPWKQ